ncbi:fumarylacetoacetate hydrolase family protein [Georgenia yuyongxinii]|uniref:Fumarylacetoacetate hydrolase family protein n=1 Tax=Georgenia yuyongxinii TaxID=2589797 RepID=A0A552WR99_9MICO|nr:fumarylacetoacetate hydrolase family protein [Georgenia yuyongxinii]TRW45265.1 fumarylacetoacetate hydrolase family protein [Georgenia yuyongxinii]
MRLVSFEHRGRPSWGVLDGTLVADLGGAGPYTTLPLALAALTTADLAALASSAQRISTDVLRMLPPVPAPGKILCVMPSRVPHGLDVVPRLADTLVADGEGLVAPREGWALNLAGGVGVVVGRPGRHLETADAWDHVAGLCLFSDVTVAEHGPGSTFPGRSLPRTAGCGPALVTLDEAGGREGLVVRTSLNGALVHEAGLAEAALDVAEAVAHCSRWTQLHPGDIIALLPGGPSQRMSVHPGDVCEVSVDRIGSLTNVVLDEADVHGAAGEPALSAHTAN